MLAAAQQRLPSIRTWLFVGLVSLQLPLWFGDGGWLEVWGDLGLGACFRLTLPRDADDVLTESPLPLVPAEALDSTPVGAP